MVFGPFPQNPALEINDGFVSGMKPCRITLPRRPPIPTPLVIIWPDYGKLDEEQRPLVLFSESIQLQFHLGEMCPNQVVLIASVRRHRTV